MPEAGKSREVALVAEPDAEPRALLQRVLRDVGYEVVVAADADQLGAALCARQLLEGSWSLAVIGVGLARRCANALTAAAARRIRGGVADVSLILTYERGTLMTVVKPSLAPCSVVAIFEKPIDLEELSSVVRVTRVGDGARRISQP